MTFNTPCNTLRGSLECRDCASSFCTSRCCSPWFSENGVANDFDFDLITQLHSRFDRDCLDPGGFSAGIRRTLGAHRHQRPTHVVPATFIMAMSLLPLSHCFASCVRATALPLFSTRFFPTFTPIHFPLPVRITTSSLRKMALSLYSR